MNQHIHGGDIYRHPDLLDFSANINPLGTPASVIEAAGRGLKMIRNYPDVQKEALIKALAAYEHVPESYIICGNGAAELVFSLVWARKPRRALMAVPTFAEYEQALEAAECEIEEYLLKEENGFVLGEDFPERITGETDIVFLCNPNNPTGVLIPDNLIDEILERCRRHHVFLVLDECFTDFLENPELATKKGKLSEYPDFFILKAFTKRYAMAGLRLGYGLCSNPDLLEHMRRMTQPWNISIPAQEAGVATLKEEDYVNKARKLTARERIWLKEELCKLDMKVYDSQANYIFFRGPGGLAGAVMDHGVMIRDCSNYQGLPEGYYRTAVRLHEENRKLIRAVRAALKDLDQKPPAPRETENGRN